MDNDLIRQFEEATLPHDRWHHAEHLAVALHYQVHRPAEAEELMVQGIQKLNAAHGVAQTPTGGYHHTLTIVWVRLLRARIRQGLSSEQLLAQQGEQILDYYSQARIMSWEARSTWVEPDLQPLP